MIYDIMMHELISIQMIYDIIMNKQNEFIWFMT